MRQSFKKSNLEFTIDSRGAQLVSLVNSGINYIWCGDPKYWDYSAPVLFPIIGKLKDLETTIQGKKYSMPQHGLLRLMEFELFEEKENSVTYVCSYDSKSLEKYPFKFKAYISYIVSNDKITTEFKIENVDDKEIYFNIGGHPGINCPLYENEEFTDYTIYFSNVEKFKSPKVMMNATLNFNEPVLGYNGLRKLGLRKEIFYIDTIIIKDVKSRRVDLLNKNNKGVRFTFENFENLAIWTPHNDAPFICLEPWQGYNDLYNTSGTYEEKEYLVHLKENECYTCSYTIEMIK